MAEEDVGRDGATAAASDDASAAANFVVGFVAALVMAGVRSIPRRDPDVRSGLRRVVEMLDERVGGMVDQDADLRRAGPWIDAGNSLRFSPVGGLDNWASALRAAQRDLSGLREPPADPFVLRVDTRRAADLLDHLRETDRKFLESATSAFLQRARRTG